jgi:hypothetical protein
MPIKKVNNVVVRKIKLVKNFENFWENQSKNATNYKIKHFQSSSLEV